MVRVRVLGSLQAQAGAGVADLGGPRQRGVLAMLLVARGDVVSVDRLIEDLWRGEPPPRATGALQAYVSHLRRALEPDRAPRTPPAVLLSVPPGYAIRLPADAVDGWQFEALVRQSASARGPDRVRELLEQALALWSGPAYAEVAAERWAQAEAARLDELRVAARERLVGAMLAAGSVTEPAALARTLTVEHPLREEGWRLLALALYAGGRQADALAALRRARSILADELGLDPGPALVELEAAILAQEVQLPSRDAAPLPADPAAPLAVGRAAPADPEAPAAPELVGREQELNALHGAARLAREGRLQVALVAGDAGAGKTALLERLRAELTAGGWRAPLGRCPEEDGAPPAWAWIEALRSLAADVDPGGHAPGLAPLLDDAAAGGHQDAAFGRFRLHRAVADWLAVATDRPLALVLDDVHRADSETLALLRSLADQLGDVPVLLVAAYRPGEVGEHLAETLAALARHAPLRLRPGGLDAAQAARLVRQVAGAQPDTSVVAALTERTGGNPFYLRESARLLASEGELVATSQVPQGVRDVLRRRFARLPEVSVAVLRQAAVVGRDVDVEVLLHAAEVDEEAVLAALDAGVVAGLLVEPGPGSVRFAHDLVREALEADLTGLRRARLHARVAGALERVHPGDLSGLAHHHAQAASPATAGRALDYAVRAAEQAGGRFAHEAAAGLYRQALTALDLLPPGPARDARAHQEQRVDLLVRLMRAQLNAGATIDARNARDEALSAAEEAGRDDLLVRVLAGWNVPMPWLTRRYALVDTRVVDLIERLLRGRDPDPADRCRLLCTLVHEIGGDDLERGRQAADEAVAIARELQDPALIGQALVEQSSIVLADREPDRRREIVLELVDVGQRHGLAAFSTLGHYGLLVDAIVRADLPAVRRSVEQVWQLATRYQFAQLMETMIMVRSMLAHATGRYEEAERHILEAGEAMRRHGAVDAENVVGLALIALRNTQGRLAEMEPTVRQMHEVYPDVAADALALVLAEMGRHAQARDLRRDLQPVRRDYLRVIFLYLRARAVVALGQAQEAPDVYADLLPFAGQLTGAVTAAFVMEPVDTTLGELALLLGHGPAAATHFAAAAELAARCGNERWLLAARDGQARAAASGPQADH